MPRERSVLFTEVACLNEKGFGVCFSAIRGTLSIILQLDPSPNLLALLVQPKADMGSKGSCYKNGTTLESPHILKVVSQGKLLAKGAFGSVYEYTVRLFGGDAVVVGKVLEYDAASYDALLAEYVTQDILQCDYVVTVLGYEVTGFGQGKGGKIVIFMEKLEPMNSDTAQPPEKVAQIAHDVASGLAYIHKKDYIHGDIKPKNVLWDPKTKRFKLGDFGLAKLLKHTHAASGMKWVEVDQVYALHMAPEAKQEQRMKLLLALIGATPALLSLSGTIKTDMFAFGLTMIRFHVGDDVIAAQAAGLSLSKIDGLLPILQRCVEEDPSKRPDASEVAAEMATMIS
jgi:serine/threonine protein kinase